MSARREHEQRRVDRRSRKTREAILSAFNRLFLKRGYEPLSPTHVARTASVGRSTFYEHFRGLDDVLWQAVQPLLLQLATNSLTDELPDRMTALLAHFWENRKVARQLLAGDSQRRVLRNLQEQFMCVLALQETRPVPNYRSSRREVLALQMAAGHLAVLEAWLSGRLRQSPNDIATALHGGARAILTSDHRLREAARLTIT